jgi:hypothetical protein
VLAALQVLAPCCGARLDIVAAGGAGRLPLMEPDKKRLVDRPGAGFGWRPAPKDVELEPKDDDFGFKTGPRFERQGHDIEAAHREMTPSRLSLSHLNTPASCGIGFSVGIDLAMTRGGAYKLQTITILDRQL